MHAPTTDDKLRRASRPAPVALLATLLLLASAGRANALHLTAGLKGTYAVGFVTADQLHQLGGGPFVEVGVIPHWLELELGVRLLGNEHGALLPIALLAKVPFELHPRVLAYAGAGPALVPAFGGGDTALHFGLETVIGAYFSFGARSPWALLVEGGYALLREHGHSVHEIVSSFGVAYRF